MDEIEPKQTERKNNEDNIFEGFFPKLFCVFTSFVGCLVLLVAPFYVPFVNLMGATIVAALSFVLAAFVGFIAVSGFSLVTKISQDKNTPFSYILTIYIVSFFSLLLSLVSLLRLIAWAFRHFFEMKIDWTFLPV